MLAKMTKTMKGSPDGIRVFEYKAGEQYNLPEKLFDAFKSIGCCEQVKKEDPKPEKMALKPENKMADKPENKSIDLPLGLDENQEQTEDGEKNSPRRRRR